MFDAQEDESQLAGPSGLYDSPSSMDSAQQELEVTVEVYISKTATAHRKVRAMATLLGSPMFPLSSHNIPATTSGPAQEIRETRFSQEYAELG